MTEVFNTMESEPKSTETLIAAAKKDALARVDNKRAKERIETGIENRLKPYLSESIVIANQINDERYLNYVGELSNYLGTNIGIVACPDGRIIGPQIAAPRLVNLHRRLAGIPDIRKSTLNQENGYVLDDPYMSASISDRIRKNREKPLIEIVGPHIDSENPLHGCGALKIITTSTGSSAQTAMAYGGIPKYFEMIGNGLSAFSNAAEKAGGKGYVVDATHDAYSQGLIFGLKSVYDQKGADAMFDRDINLRENLLQLHNNKKIVMTELLDETLKQEVLNKFAQTGESSLLELRNPRNLAKNMQIIGRIAMEINQSMESAGFPFIPDSLKVSDDKVNKTISFIAIRNSVYRILGNIKPGNHNLLHHPEQIIRVGPVGAAYNVETIPFTQVTPPGELRPQDIDGVKKLYGLSETILPTLGADLNKEARIIVATGEFNAKDYSSDQVANRNHENAIAVTRNNAAHLRSEFNDGVKNGEVAIISMLFEGSAKGPLEVV